MATIYDVAKAAGVSPKTVSRVLNGDAPVGVKTRKAVERAMSELGYVPSSAARTMRSNKSGLIGLITGAISHTPESADPNGLPDLFIVQGIQDVISNSKMTLMIADTAGKSENVPHLIKTFLQHRVEGLIHVADYHREVSLPPITGDCPLVLANCFDVVGTPAVLPDDRKCQSDLVEKLLHSGHRRIGFLTLDRRMTASGLRYAGYRDALETFGVEYADELVRMGFEEGRERESHLLTSSLNQLLELSDPPTVICCGNDEMALRVYGLLRSRGIRIPEDISVAGFDNYRAISETLYPLLTTVELPYREMGRRAAERLLEFINKTKYEHRAPELIAGPVFWRSSVNTLNSVSIINTSRRKL